MYSCPGGNVNKKSNYNKRLCAVSCFVQSNGGILCKENRRFAGAGTYFGYRFKVANPSAGLSNPLQSRCVEKNYRKNPWKWVYSNSWHLL